MKNKNDRFHIDISLVRSLSFDKETHQPKKCDKDTLSTVAFCLMVKDRFVNSIVFNATMRNLNEIFKIGHKRMKRIIERGTEMGLISFDKNRNLYVHQLRSQGRAWRKVVMRSKVRYKLQHYINLLDEIATENLLQIVADHQDSHFYASSSQKRSRKREERGKDSGMSDDELQFNLPLSRIAEKIGRSKTQVSKVIRRLLYIGEVSKRACIYSTYLKSANFNGEVWAKVPDKYGHITRKKVCGHTFFSGIRGEVLVHCGNIYSFNRYPDIWRKNMK